MKQLLTVLMLVISLGLSAQSLSTDYYTCYRSEMWSLKGNKYTPVKINEDVDIDLSVTENVISINGNIASVYKIYRGSDIDISQSEYNGTRFKGYSVTTGDQVYIDMGVFKSNKAFVMDFVYYTSGSMLRYYIYKK